MDDLDGADANSSSSDESASDPLSDETYFSDASDLSFIDPSEDKQFNDNLKALIDSKDAKDKEVLKQMIINMVNIDNSSIFIMLVSHDFKFEVLNDNGQTLMHLAFYSDSFGILQYCIELLPCIQNNHIDYTDCNGLSHFHIICHSEQEKTLQIVEQCLKNGANVNASSFQNDPTKNESGFTPLHWASSAPVGPEAVITLLLKYKANIDAVDKSGRTALHLLCSMFRVPKQFSQKGERVMKKMELLLKNGCNVNVRDKQGNTPLHNVFLDNDNFVNLGPYEKKDSVPLIQTWLKFKLLLRYGADVTASNNNDDTILHCVIKTLKHVRSLLDPTFDDHTHVEIIKKMLAADKNINVNAMNCAGETPLQLAVSMMSVNISKLLLDQGADMSRLTLIKENDHCFYKSRYLPNLRAVKNAKDMLELLLEKEFKLNLHENWAFMRFLLHNVDYNVWVEVLDTKNVRNSKKVMSFLENLLEYGSPERIKRVFNLMLVTLLAKEKYHLKYKIGQYVLDLIIRKIKANFYVDQEICDIINFTDDVLLTYIGDEKYDNEIALMENTLLTDDVALHDVIVKHPFDIYQYVRDADCEELTRKLSHYKTSVDGHIAKCLVRNHMKKTSSGYLGLLLPTALPKLCCENILYYLSNEDVLNVCTAALTVHVDN